ncbi:MAG: tRNA (adenosine(37)-N6)-dimethylallyltransferase MiaA [Candidatus Omnitrophota bacterium]
MPLKKRFNPGALQSRPLGGTSSGCNNLKPQGKIIFIVGPTAAGKSAVAAALAKRLKSHVLSCDSMQVYKGMDIIASKPASALRKKIKHHFISSVSCQQEYDVFRYRKEAGEIVDRLTAKGKIPVFCGGTGLYVSVLIDGIFKEGKSDPALRKKLYGQARKYGKGYLYNRLKKVDKSAAGRIHPNDLKRVIRALEVFEASGKPISALQKERKGLSNDYSVKIFCLNMDRAALYRRIDTRVDNMLKAGLLKEAKKLLAKQLSRTASAAIGIKETAGYFEGRHGLEEALRLIKRNTRHYAKRQLSWFRKDKRVKWVNIKDKDKPQKIAQRILKLLQG